MSQAAVHVFVLLAEPDQAAIGRLNLDQWEFYVLPTSMIDEHQRSLHSVTLPNVCMSAHALARDELERAVADPYGSLR